MSKKAAAADSQAKPVVLHCDLPSEVRDFAFKAAADALKAESFEKDQAAVLKKAMEGYNGELWHVVVGEAFGASVSHENNGLLLFRIGKVHFLMFQSYNEARLVKSDGPVSTTRISNPVSEAKKAEDDDEDA